MSIRLQADATARGRQQCFTSLTATPFFYSLFEALIHNIMTANTDTPQTSTALVATPRDYRDDLQDLLDKQRDKTGITRYRVCKQMGIDSGTLSNVLAKRRHFSLERLNELLALLEMKMIFVPVEAAEPIEEAHA